MKDLPIGSIILWATESIPIGWNICDGGTYNGVVTPNMVGKFPVGASGAGDLGSTGGSATHTHTNSTGASARTAHDHGGAIGGNTGGDNGYTDAVAGTGSSASGHGHSHSASGTIGAADTHAHAIPGNTGAGSSLPVHKKLYYIMRTL